MKPVRAAVVGAGSFGRNHVRVIRDLQNVELAAIVDSDLTKAQQLASEFDSTPFRSLDDITGKIDAAIVATPTVTHEPIAARLIEAGLDVLIEKPIAESSAAGLLAAVVVSSRSGISSASTPPSPPFRAP